MSQHLASSTGVIDDVIFLEPVEATVVELNDLTPMENGWFRCPVTNCSFTSNGMIGVRVHTGKVHHDPLSKIYACPDPHCNRTYTRHRVMLEHWRKFHRKLETTGVSQDQVKRGLDSITPSNQTTSREKKFTDRESRCFLQYTTSTNLLHPANEVYERSATKRSREESEKVDDQPPTKKLRPSGRFCSSCFARHRKSTKWWMCDKCEDYRLCVSCKDVRWSYDVHSKSCNESNK